MKNKELSMGKKVEKEHLDTIKKVKTGKLKTDEQITESIAKDHLKEIDNYYTELKKMEDYAKKVGKTKIPWLLSNEKLSKNEKLIIDYIKKHKNLDDDKFHKFVESKGLNPHEAEEIIYKLFNIELNKSVQEAGLVKVKVPVKRNGKLFYQERWVRRGSKEHEKYSDKKKQATEKHEGTKGTPQHGKEVKTKDGIDLTDPKAKGKQFRVEAVRKEGQQATPDKYRGIIGKFTGQFNSQGHPKLKVFDKKENKEVYIAVPANTLSLAKAYELSSQILKSKSIFILPDLYSDNFTLIKAKNTQERKELKVLQELLIKARVTKYIKKWKEGADWRYLYKDNSLQGNKLQKEKKKIEIPVDIEETTINKKDIQNRVKEKIQHVQDKGDTHKEGTKLIKKQWKEYNKEGNVVTKEATFTVDKKKAKEFEQSSIPKFEQAEHIGDIREIKKISQLTSLDIDKIRTQETAMAHFLVDNEKYWDMVLHKVVPGLRPDDFDDARQELMIYVYEKLKQPDFNLDQQNNPTIGIAFAKLIHVIAVNKGRALKEKIDREGYREWNNSLDKMLENQDEESLNHEFYSIMRDAKTKFEETMDDFETKQTFNLLLNKVKDELKPRDRKTLDLTLEGFTPKEISNIYQKEGRKISTLGVSAGLRRIKDKFKEYAHDFVFETKSKLQYETIMFLKALFGIEISEPLMKSDNVDCWWENGQWQYLFKAKKEDKKDVKDESKDKKETHKGKVKKLITHFLSGLHGLYTKKDDKDKEEDDTPKKEKD